MRIKPVQRNKLHIPVNIYQDERLVKEAGSMREATRWMKIQTGESLNKLRETIANGIWFYEPFSFHEHTYFFETDPNAVQRYFEKTNKIILFS